MGFPVGYSELPKILLHFLLLLSQLRRLATWLLALLRLDPPRVPDFLPPSDSPLFYPSSLDLLNRHLPVISFADLATELGLAGGAGHLPEGCAVCLHEFEGVAEVRRPIGCCHVFHRGCLDRWAAHGRSTCPLCRAAMVPDECYVA